MPFAFYQYPNISNIFFSIAFRLISVQIFKIYLLRGVRGAGGGDERAKSHFTFLGLEVCYKIFLNETAGREKGGVGLFEFDDDGKGGLQKLLNGFFPLRGRYPPFPFLPIF